ncbi:MAG: DJ-1/PfpI family protein [Chloroflexota bacterium]
MQIAILLYNNMTALDAIGPYDVLSRIPRATVCWVATEVGPIRTDAGLGLIADYQLDDVPRPDVLLVPGGKQNEVMRDERVLSWIRGVHQQTRYTTSVCTGSLILGAAGVLKGVKATTHWYVHPQLKRYGARPVRRRVVRHGKIVTAAGVSAGIDMALQLTGKIASSTVAKTIQLGIEYDPEPPYDSGSLEAASLPIRWLSRVAMSLYSRKS